jgi:heterodisulfide reductase subunit C
VWTKNVYDIIQNYQYKYLKTIEDVRMRERRVSKMERLVQLLKKSALHAGVEAELAKADKALNELVTRAGEATPAYTRIRRRMTKLKEALKEVRRVSLSDPLPGSVCSSLASPEWN